MEIFVVIDNTEWPEALKDNAWREPLRYNEETENMVFLEIHINSFFTSTSKH
jgi:hypothetical protein